MKNLLFFCFVTLFITIFNSNAIAFRCGKDIVSRWDKSASVLTKCGNPFHSTVATENVDGFIQYVDRWYYNCGENDFIYSLSIHNGTIIKIDSLNRGTGHGQCK